MDRESRLASLRIPRTIVPRQYYATPFVPPVIRGLLVGLEEVFTWLRVRLEFPMDVVLRILLPRGRDWKFETQRPPQLNFTGVEGALYAGGHTLP
jgi:hypothetical protein